MRKGLIAILAVTLVLGFIGYTLAQQAPHNPGRGQHMMGQGQMGPMGGQGMMGPPDDGFPADDGAMMSMRGEMMTLMGEMMQKYGGAMGQMTPELRQQMGQEMLEQMGEILTKHGTALKERAKDVRK